MMDVINIYLVVFFLVLFADIYKKEAKGIYWIVISITVIVLCFGYMTGTDWRNYENLWDGTEDMDELSNLNLEFSFKGIMKFSQTLTNDFWIFSAAMKIIFMHSLLLFFRQYTIKPWMAFALGMDGTVLFMLIECPMRFMLGLAFVQYGIVAFYHNKKILALVLAFVGSTCHMTIIIVILLWLTRPLAKFFVKLNTPILLFLFFLMFWVISQASAYQQILSLAFNFTEFSKYEKSYGEFSTGEFMNLGTITRLIFLIIPCLMKNEIIKCLGDKGKEVVYFACLSSYLGLFLGGIPTAFRLNTLNNIYITISVCYLINYSLVNHSRNFRQIIQFSRLLVICFIAILILKKTHFYKYQPYSNSIPYILTEHLPYNYRFDYNLKQYGGEE